MTRIVLIALALVVALLAVACASPAQRDAGDRLGPVSPPPQVTVPPDLSTPERSVRTYLEYVTLGYRMLNSEATTKTATPAENVRIDAYIELNRQEGRGIDQRLIDIETRLAASEGATATVVTEEQWVYRYFSPQTQKYTSPGYEASYDATYTVLRQPDDTWLVDSVQATSRGELK